MRATPSRNVIGGMSGKETAKGKVQSYLAEIRKREKEERIQGLRSDLIATGMNKVMEDRLSKIDHHI